MRKFRHAFRYIDDICWIKVQNPSEFLDPLQPRTPDNPFWIYPLNFLEIKTEVEKYAMNEPRRGIAAHFMNLHVNIDTNLPTNFLLRKYDK